MRLMSSDELHSRVGLDQMNKWVDQINRNEKRENVNEPNEFVIWSELFFTPINGKY